MSLTEVLSAASFVIVLATIVGGWLVIKSAISRSEGIVQARVREAQADEIVLLQEQMSRLEKEQRQCRAQFRLVLEVLRKLYNLRIEVKDDVVTIHEGKTTHVFPTTPDKDASPP